MLFLGSQLKKKCGPGGYRNFAYYRQLHEIRHSELHATSLHWIRYFQIMTKFPSLNSPKFVFLTFQEPLVIVFNWRVEDMSKTHFPKGEKLARVTVHRTARTNSCEVPAHQAASRSGRSPSLPPGHHKYMCCFWANAQKLTSMSYWYRVYIFLSVQ